MAENKLKSVWVLTYNNLTMDYAREIFGVYSSEDAANNALNNDLFPQYAEIYDVYEGQNLSNDEIYDRLFNELNPEVEQFSID